MTRRAVNSSGKSPLKCISSYAEDKKIIKLLKELVKKLRKEKPTSKKYCQPVIIPRAQHGISRKDIHPNALKVLYRLHSAGFSAYLVGGCVRDLLLGYHPKDFDVATDAHPEDVRKIFKNCRLIGRRFRLAHVVFGRDIIEVATFRAEHNEKHGSLKGMILRDNEYGTIEDDAWRRDFTINALYYNIADFSVVDYVGGMQDIQTKTLRIIGDANVRYREDPMRILRAVRIAGKLDLQISADTEKPLQTLNHLLQDMSTSRSFLEILKLFQGGSLFATFLLLQKYQLFEKLFPQSATLLKNSAAKSFIEIALKNADQRLTEGKTISPAFLFAVFLWYPIQQETDQLKSDGLPIYVALEKSIRNVLQTEAKFLSIPRAITQTIHDICFLQLRFNNRHGARPYRLLEHPRFRAAFDLILLRAQVEQPLQELAQWWKKFHDENYDVDHTKPRELRRPAHKRSPLHRRHRSRTTKPPSSSTIEKT